MKQQEELVSAFSVSEGVISDNTHGLLAFLHIQTFFFFGPLLRDTLVLSNDFKLFSL